MTDADLDLDRTDGTMASMADWISPAIGGLVGAGAGGSISVWIASSRLRFERKQAASKREVERRALARPAVIKIADLFTEIEGRVTPSWEVEFLDGVGDFGEWWNTESERVAPKLRRLVLEVPDSDYRQRFEVVVHGLEWSYPIHQRIALGDQEVYLRRISRLGAELAGAWLREQDPADAVLALYRNLVVASDLADKEINKR